MKRDEFERMVIQLWTETRIPLTRAHVEYHTGQKPKRVRKYLDELVVDGTLEVDATNQGEMMWSVPGRSRALDGEETFEELERHQRIREKARQRVLARRAGKQAKSAGPEPEQERRQTSKALVKRDDEQSQSASLTRKVLSLAGRAAGELDKRGGAKGKADKSLALSAGLGLLGPIGWFYAGSFKEAIPGTLLQFLVAALIPSFLLMPVLLVALPASALAGLLYAWGYNRKGHRGPLFLKGKDDDE